MSIATTVDESDVETESVRELTAFQRNILTILAEESTYGLGIKRELESYYGEEVNHGRLYPNLDDLVEMGLVEKGQLDRRTNEYSLTEAGYAAVGDQVDWILSKLLTDEDRVEDVQQLVENHS